MFSLVISIIKTSISFHRAQDHSIWGEQDTTSGSKGEKIGFVVNSAHKIFYFFGSFEPKFDGGLLRNILGFKINLFG